MMFVKLVVSSIFSYLSWSLVTLQINHRRASTMGIPLIRLPTDPLNVFFQVLEPHIFRLLDALPISLPECIYCLRRGWYFKDKADMHLKYGPVWALVTPRDIHVHLSDSEAIHEVFSRRADFIRPSKMYELLEVYGPCISTADVKNWPRHRKILAAPFSESAMSYVWSESLHQTQQMMQTWISAPRVSSVGKDMRTLSLNVLAAIGFRRSFHFRGSNNNATIREDGMFSYRDALQIVLDNVILLMLIPRRYLTYSWMPASLQRIGHAASDFKKHMVQMLDEETRLLSEGKKGSGSLMTSFIQAQARSERSKDTGSNAPQGLSVDEIFGNIFVINFAGHDTTANTLAFSTLLLAAHPAVQEWVAEEVTSVISGKPEEEWNYADLFPRLKRCQAVLLETLRLYPPIMALPKSTNEYPQPLQVGDRRIVIPPRTGVQPNIIATQTHPQYWGPDPRAWRPSRWITTSSGDQEGLVTPPRDTFLPWSDGPQNCPGMNFSQVEFVAVLARLLFRHRLQVIKERPLETDAEATARVLRVVNECDAQMLLRMLDPDRVSVACVPAL
ncbi:cytochrome P450 [Aaosphaeria arxii CBS 175.79]|uniref:Cytochrome P450 n=1 Tax=Aaosphaeria arxii CBS 175.79 TaxID=1450172 RepID=A0A6A5XQX4_9PLEO|nr:cytochrome P450 [Aaosphaeria arxii CBS 175.79]KAF2015678.1 cytochrome P450 [Aaosphaeria arxii CBS 175.79]